MLPGRRTPWIAIAATTKLAMLLALTGSVAESAALLLLLLVFFVVNSAVLVLRRDPGESDRLRVPTAIPVLGLTSRVVLATQIETQVWLRGLMLIAVGVVLAAVATSRLHKAIDTTGAEEAAGAGRHRTEVDRPPNYQASGNASARTWGIGLLLTR